MAGPDQLTVNCRTCRSRKIKCDRKTPVCGHCARSQRICVYPHAFDAIHRSANQRTEARAQKCWRLRAQRSGPTCSKRTTSSPLGSDATANSSTIVGLPELERQQESIESNVVSRYHYLPTTATPDPGTALSTDVFEVAFCRFNYDFLEYSTGGYAKSHTFDLFTPLCKDLPRDGLLLTALKAVSLANLAARTHSPHVRLRSQEHYIKTLSLLSVNVQTPETARRADTVFASYLLWLYEVVTKHDSWCSAMAHLIGSESLMRIAVQQSSQSLVQFSKSGIGVLSVNHALMRALGSFQQPSPWLEHLVRRTHNLGSRGALVELCFDCARLCSQMKDCEYLIRTQGALCLSNPSRLASTRLLDARFQAWEESHETVSPRVFMNIRAKDRKVAWVRDLFGLPGAPKQMCVSIAPDDFLEWKMYWIFRLSLNYCILDQVDALETSASTSIGHGRLTFTPSDVAAAEEVIATITHDLLASVPQVLGIQPPTSATIRTTETGSQAEQGQLDPESASNLSGIRGYHLFWPIFNLLKSFNRQRIRASGNKDVEAWIAHLLRFLWQDIGIAQAECFRNWFEHGLITDFPTIY